MRDLIATSALAVATMFSGEWISIAGGDDYMDRPHEPIPQPWPRPPRVA